MELYLIAGAITLASSILLNVLQEIDKSKLKNCKYELESKLIDSIHLVNEYRERLILLEGARTPVRRQEERNYSARRPVVTWQDFGNPSPYSGSFVNDASDVVCEYKEFVSKKKATVKVESFFTE